MGAMRCTQVFISRVHNSRSPPYSGSKKAVPKLPYKSLALAWIGDFNPVMMRMVESYVCATKHKMHTTYRYLFDRTKEFHRCPRMGVKRRE